MNEKTKLAIKAFDELKNSDLLDIDSYHKCLVELSYNTFRDGDLDACIQTIGRVSPDYFLTKQVEHMLEDENYKNMVLYMAYKFIQMGVVEAGLEINPTQNSGRA